MESFEFYKYKNNNEIIIANIEYDNNIITIKPKNKWKKEDIEHLIDVLSNNMTKERPDLNDKNLYDKIIFINDHINNAYIGIRRKV